MAFRHGWRFKLLQQSQNHLLWNRTWTALVLRENCSDRWLNVNDLNPRSVICKEIDPALPHLPRNISPVECEALPHAQMFAALLACGLDDFALIIGGLNVQRFANGIQRNDRDCGSMLGQPSVFACSGKS